MATLLLVVIYASFISLGLPDSLLGVSWPLMQPYFKVPFGFAGLVSMTISGGTIVSSLLSSRALRRFGTGKVTAVSVLMTALALLGISLAPSFFWLFLLALPLGLGAGAVDSGLNEYVAEHYAARHMSWLHCFWGVGALSGPLIMSRYTASGESWRATYGTIAAIQFALVAIIALSLPLWGKAARSKAAGSGKDATHEEKARQGDSGLLAPLRLGGIKIALVSFLFYCGAEASMGLWGASYLVKSKGLDAATAASWISLFYGGITVGRLVSGFVSMAVKNRTLIRGGDIMIDGRGPRPHPPPSQDLHPRRLHHHRPGLRAHLSIHAARDPAALRPGQRAGGHGIPDGGGLHRLDLPAAPLRLHSLDHEHGTSPLLHPFLRRCHAAELGETQRLPHAEKSRLSGALRTGARLRKRAHTKL